MQDLLARRQKAQPWPELAARCAIISETRSSASRSGVASVTPVTPVAVIRRLSSARSLSRRCSASDQPRSALRRRPSGCPARPTRPSAAELRIHSAPLRCWMRTGTWARTASRAARSSSPGDRLVVADGANPPVGARASHSTRVCASCSLVLHRGRSDGKRIQRGCRRTQVHVVVVQPGQHRSAARVEHTLTLPGARPLTAPLRSARRRGYRRVSRPAGWPAESA